ncbi:MAG TPA: dihydroorotate dehydrogenase electron transfer subunit [Candidatus Acidoferrum sp.]|nr:dihydroorotate dehydrogenase electron transfer subunit [Candidatus Acidoferrum sp.]
MNKMELCEVLSVSHPREGVADITISAKMAKSAQPGQFLHIKCGDDMLLRRPISICDAADDTMRIVVEDVGAGSRWLVNRKPGDALDVLGPLGKTPFKLPKPGDDPILLIGGGLGAAPLLMLAKRAGVPVDVVLGFRSEKLIILEKDFADCCQLLYVCTDDGSYGHHGTVTQIAERRIARTGYQAIYACGPIPMLRAVAELGDRVHIPTFVSLEARMCCGVGSCLGCAVKTKDDRYVHVCKEGPVFDAKEVAW